MRGLFQRLRPLQNGCAYLTVNIMFTPAYYRDFYANMASDGHANVNNWRVSGQVVYIWRYIFETPKTLGASKTGHYGKSQGERRFGCRAKNACRRHNS